MARRTARGRRRPRPPPEGPGRDPHGAPRARPRGARGALPAGAAAAVGVRGRDPRHRSARGVDPGGRRGSGAPHRPRHRRAAHDQPGQPGRVGARALRARRAGEPGRAGPDHRLDHGHLPAGARAHGGRLLARAPDFQARARGAAVDPARAGADRAPAAGGVRLHRPPRAPRRGRRRFGRGSEPFRRGGSSHALRGQPGLHARHPSRRVRLAGGRTRGSRDGARSSFWRSWARPPPPSRSRPSSSPRRRRRPRPRWG